jgi:hypothetical protein
MVSNLKNIITGDFVANLQKFGIKNDKNAAQEVAASLRGGASGQTLDSSLRTGARNFGLGMQALNLGINVVNVATQAHERLDGILSEMRDLAHKASSGGVSSQEAAQYITTFRTKSRQFQKIIDDTDFDDKKILNVDDLEASLLKSGLDPKRSSDLTRALRGLTSLDETETDVDGEIVSRTNLIPVEEFAAAVRAAAGDFEAAGTEEVEARGRALAEVTRKLDRVADRLGKNLKALEATREVVIENMDLIRAAGLAMLDLSRQIKGSEDAEDVAREIREKIRREAPKSLDHAGNLEGIVVAGLTLAGEAQAKSGSSGS